MWYQTVAGEGAGSFFGIPDISEGGSLNDMFPDVSDTAFSSVDEGIVEATTDNGSSLWYSSAFYDEPDAPHTNIQASDGVGWYAMNQQAVIPQFETGDGSEAYNNALFQSFMPGYEGNISSVIMDNIGKGQMEIRNDDGSAVRFYDAAMYQTPRGEYVSYEDSKGGQWYAINGEPSVVKVPEYEDGKPVYTGNRMHTTLKELMIFFSLLIPDISNEEEQMLDEAIIKTYEEKGITYDNDSLYIDKVHKKMKEMPIIGDFHKNLLNNKMTERVAIIVSRFVTGSAQAFNRQTNVDLSNKYIVLDLSELKGNLLPVGMMIALDYVWDTVRSDRTKKKAIMIDEIWQLVGAQSNRMAAEFCLTIFKTIRGFDLL